MVVSEEIERIFKLRQEFKDCQKSEDQKVVSEAPSHGNEAARIAELIEKIKN